MASRGAVEEWIGRRWRRLLLAFVLTLMGLSALTGIALRMRAHEQVLDRRAVETEAVVLSSDSGREPDSATVRYLVEGREVTTTLTVHDSDDFPDQTRVAIEYDPQNPAHARPLSGWSPSYEHVLTYAIILAPTAAIIFGITLLRDRRTARILRRPGVVSDMHARIFRKTLFTRRHTQWLVGLWPADAVPSTPPPLVVEVDASDARRVQSRRVRVHGRAEPGARVVLEADGAIVWSAGKLKKALPEKAEAVDEL